MLTGQDVGCRILTPSTRVKNQITNSKAEDYGVRQTKSPDTAVLVIDHSIVLRIVSFNSPQTELSKDTIDNTIDWWFVRGRYNALT